MTRPQREGEATEAAPEVGRNVARRLRTFLARPQAIAWIAALALVLALPSLGVGMLMDDYFHHLVIQGSPRFPDITGNPFDMFRFFPGDPEHARRLMEHGIVAWWTYPELKAAFLRPLTVLTHWLDYVLWPRHVWAMHLQSVLWFVGGVVALGVFYRRIFGAVWLAGFATLLYAIDDTHGMTIGWLANRNALIAVFFGLCCLIAHDRWRRDGSRAAGVLASLLLASSLLSAEAGIATCAYLFAYAVVRDEGPWRRRILSLAPYGVIIVVWRVVWKALGYGVANMGIYTDPLGEPLTYLMAVVHRAPVLLLAQWAYPPAELGMVVQPAAQRILLIVALAFVGLLTAVLIPVVRNDRTARFFGLGMALALLPVCATAAADRLLFFVGIGAMGLLALFLSAVFGASPWRPRSLAWRAPAVSLGVVFVVVHLIAAPLLMPLRAAYPMGPKILTDNLLVRTPMDDSVGRQDVIVVNPPSPLHAGYLPVVREVQGQTPPRSTLVLAPGMPAVTLTAVDEHTVRVRPEAGYFSSTFDHLFRSEDHPMGLGWHIDLTGVRIEVTELTEDGRPAEATFRFDEPLRDPSLRWLQWKDGEYVPFTPPAVGETVEVRIGYPLWGGQSSSARDRRRADHLVSGITSGGSRPSTVEPWSLSYRRDYNKDSKMI